MTLLLSYLANLHIIIIWSTVIEGIEKSEPQFSSRTNYFIDWADTIVIFMVP